MDNPPFPLDADVGDYAIGPDGRRYRYDYDDCWHVAGDQRRPGDKPIPHISPDDPARRAAEEAANLAFNARLKAEEAATRAAVLAEAAATAARETRAADARAALAAQDIRPDPDDQEVGVYEGEWAAVIAEVPPGQRADGWTAARRVLFLERLAEGGSILAAARCAGVTRQSLYKLLPRAPHFAAAVEEVMKRSYALLADTLLDRAIHGHQVPIVHKGEIVATKTIHHDQLGCYLLRVRDPLNYAPVDELDRWMHRRGIGTDESARPSLSGGGAGETPQDPRTM